jgi:transposase InsO family protein
MDTIARQPRPLGRDGQQPLLTLRRRSKTQALSLYRWAARHGISLRAVATRIGVAEQTVSDWMRRRTVGRLDTVARGRPQHLPSSEVKDQVLELLDECRGRLGLPLLKQAFAQVPRTSLHEIRRIYRSEHDGSMEHLTWTTPGRVWAADFTQADAVIDARYRHVLSVRDLASHYQLLSLPVLKADAITTVCTLVHLFAAHGAPLLLKTDNGSHFVDHRVLLLLSTTGVTHLLSPPMTPRYNGSKEAGIGSLKTRTLHIAAAHGRPDHWTCDDVEAARAEANLQARPWRRTGPAPIEVWEQRAAVTDDERTRFRAALDIAMRNENQKIKERMPGSSRESAAGDPANDPLNAIQRATVARRAIRRVLL